MGNVVIAADVLAVGEPDRDSDGRVVGWQGDPVFVAEFVDPEQRLSADSWERLALAMGRMSRLFMQIDERGRVVAFDDRDESGAYTPNFVSDPDLSVRGTSIYADTKGFLSRDMGEAMLHALVEELGRLPFDTRISGDDGTDWAGVKWQPPHAELLRNDELSSPADPAGERRARPRFVVIAREVRCLVRDGVPDVVVEYLDTDGRWTTSVANARRFERGPFGGASEIADRLARSMLDET
ncbi:hypothetical protein [Nocardioides zeicaulis]|uniref:Uncharacterized protein n=1 Tax=Nocardioides zeicaulis TaxID=1776857 RepID=A0ABV6DWA6_9ACTN